MATTQARKQQSRNHKDVAFAILTFAFEGHRQDVGPLRPDTSTWLDDENGAGFVLTADDGTRYRITVTPA
jgi:hypothetical protein